MNSEYDITTIGFWEKGSEFANLKLSLSQLGRLQITLVTSGKPKRFENRISYIVGPKKYTGQHIALKLKSTVSEKFCLLGNDTIFFDPQSKTWFSFSKNEQKSIFMVECVGWIYNHEDYFEPESWTPKSVWYDNPISFKVDPKKLMDNLGIVISGSNIRSILWKKLYTGVWESDFYNIENIYLVKGEKLLKLLDRLINNPSVRLTFNEIEVFDMYTKQELILNS